MFHRTKNTLGKILVKFYSPIKEKNIFYNTIPNEFFNINNYYQNINCRKTKFDNESNVLKNSIGLSNKNNTLKQKSIKYTQYLSDKFEG